MEPLGSASVALRKQGTSRFRAAVDLGMFRCHILLMGAELGLTDALASWTQR